MPRPKKTTLVSFKHAYDGIAHVFKTQRYAKVLAVFAILVISAGAYRSLTREQWFMVYVALAIAFLALMVATSVHACVDLYAEQHAPVTDKVRQIASGGTLAATVLAAVIIALVFLSPPL